MNLPTFPALLITIVLTATGCGTCSNLENNRQAYGGVQRDQVAISQFYQEGFGPKLAGEDLRDISILMGSLYLVDLPLSAVGDTLTLPITAWPRGEAVSQTIGQSTPK